MDLLDGLHESFASGMGLTPEPVAEGMLNLACCFVSGLIQANVPSHVVELGVNGANDFISINECVPGKVPLLSLIPHHHALLMLSPSLTDYAPLMYKKNLAFECLQIHPFPFLLGIKSTLIK